MAASKETDGSDADPAVRVEGLRKEYDSGGEVVTAVDGVNFRIESGTAVGLLGPNGAGKTTTIKSMLSLVVPTAGEIRVGGIDVHDHSAAAYRRLSAMLEGARNLYWRLTVHENMRVFSAVAGNEPRRCSDRHERLLEQFGLSDRADVPVRELSRGQKQKAALVCTMARDTDIILFDEPTLGLDVKSSRELRSEIKTLVEEEDSTVLLSSHDMDVVEDVCDRVIIMNEGRVVVDDDVSSLLDLFETRRYEVVIDGTVSSSLRERLRGSFAVERLTDRGGTTYLELYVGTDELYELIDALRADHGIDSINAVEPDLEDVFLDVTQDGGR